MEQEVRRLTAKGEEQKHICGEEKRRKQELHAKYPYYSSKLSIFKGKISFLQQKREGCTSTTVSPVNWSTGTANGFKTKSTGLP